MKKKNSFVEKSNKYLILGTVFKILLPGTGIGSVITAYGWANGLADVYSNPENWKKTMEEFIAATNRNDDDFVNDEVNRLMKNFDKEINEKFKKERGSL